MTTDESRTVGPWARKPASCQALRSSDDGRPTSFSVEMTGIGPVIQHHAGEGSGTFRPRTTATAR
ncbi:hypothetical protein GCM10010269_83130 [Streptomyces humidus]|uniref:Uncharacterized protein n=1 Tax=Streptomyces humidus TaxID=52259 RepID=A0A918LDF2_9ACTN|nr:hypothetical protein GCM10010269_83130 [Streptomyces humidus]